MNFRRSIRALSCCAQGEEGWIMGVQNQPDQDQDQPNNRSHPAEPASADSPVFTFVRVPPSSAWLLLLATLVLYLAHAYAALALRTVELPAWLEALIESTAIFAVFFPVIYVCLIRPLTLQIKERQRSQAQLQQSEEKYRLLFALNPQPMWVYELESLRFLAVNDAAVTSYGYSQEEFGSMTIKDIRPPEDIPKLLNTIARLRNGINKSGTWRHRKKDGTIIDVNIISSRMQFSARPAELVLALDVTRQKQADDALRTAEMLYRTLFEQSPDGVLIIDPATTMPIAFNEAAHRTLGYSREEFSRLRIADYDAGSNPKDIQASVEKVLREGRDDFEVLHRAKSGRILNVFVTAKTIDFADKKAFHCVFRDVTSQKKLEAQFLRAQRMESVGTLAGGIAHDLNNVLSPILMSAELLRDTAPDNPQRSLVEVIEQSARRGAAIVRQVLTFARGIQGERAEVQLKHLMRELALIVKETFPKSISVHCEVPKDLWTIQGDATQLHQVLLNLSVNARDAMPAGGLLTLAAQNMHLDGPEAALISGLKPGPHILISVTDTGQGIPEEILDKIFDPFFTTKAPDKGTGLGLSTALGIVKSHGGAINVYSELSRGTHFNIYLPAIPSPVTRAAEEERSALPDGNGEWILVADDERPVRELARLILESHGYRVLLACDGAEALAIHREHRGGIQMVILDLMMPNLGGLAALRGLRESEPALPALLISGLADQATSAEIGELQADGFLQKPFSNGQLLRAVREIVRTQGAARTAG